MGQVNCSASDCVGAGTLQRPGVGGWLQSGSTVGDCFDSLTGNRGGTGGSLSQQQNLLRLRIPKGTPRELQQEWSQIQSKIASSFGQDPKANVVFLEISRPMLIHLLRQKTKGEVKKSSATNSRQQQQMNQSKQVPNNILVSGEKQSATESQRFSTPTQSMNSKRLQLIKAEDMSSKRNSLYQVAGSLFGESAKASEKNSYESRERRQQKEKQKESQEERINIEFCLKDLTAYIRLFTSYSSFFLPLSVQSEPSPVDMQNQNENKSGKKSQNYSSNPSKNTNQSLPQMKALYELELMSQKVVLCLADVNKMRRFDFSCPEKLKTSNFGVLKISVSPGVGIEVKSRQILNQIRDLYHLKGQLALGAVQESENDFILVTVHGSSKSEPEVRQKFWPSMFQAEVVHSLSLLPSIMLQESVRRTHQLQAIIKIQSYQVLNPQSISEQNSDQNQNQIKGQQSNQSNRFKQSSSTSLNQQPKSVKQKAQQASRKGQLKKVVQYLVIFKKVLFLPREIDYQLQLQKDVVWLVNRVQGTHLLSMVHNLGPQTFLFVLSNAELPQWTEADRVDSISRMLQLLREQNETSSKNVQQDDNRTTEKHINLIQPETRILIDQGYQQIGQNQLQTAQFYGNITRQGGHEDLVNMNNNMRSLERPLMLKSLDPQTLTSSQQQQQYQQQFQSEQSDAGQFELLSEDLQYFQKYKSGNFIKEILSEKEEEKKLDLKSSTGTPEAQSSSHIQLEYSYDNIQKSFTGLETEVKGSKLLNQNKNFEEIKGNPININHSREIDVEAKKSQEFLEQNVIQEEVPKQLETVLQVTSAAQIFDQKQYGDLFSGKNTLKVQESQLSQYGSLQGDYILDFSQKSDENRPGAFLIDTQQKIGKIDGKTYIHYNSGLLETDQKQILITDQNRELRKMVDNCAQIFFAQEKQIDMRYLGLESHWHMFYREGSLTDFIYISSRQALVYNCMYEVQISKRHFGKQSIFGQELAFEVEFGGGLNGQREFKLETLAVRVERPGLFLDDFLSIWMNKDMAGRFQEHYSANKLLYIVLQMLTKINQMLIQTGLASDCLRLRSFYIDRCTLQLQMGEHAFLRQNSDQNNKRGALNGLSNDQASLAAIFERLILLPQNDSQTKLFLCQLLEVLVENYGAGIGYSIEKLMDFLRKNVNQLIKQFTVENKSETTFEVLFKTLEVSSMRYSPFSYNQQRSKQFKVGDLIRIPLQSRPFVCSRVVQNETSANIFTFLTQIQDKLTSSVIYRKPKNDLSEKSFSAQNSEQQTFQRAHISDLKPLPKGSFKRQIVEKAMTEEEIDTLANVGLTLLFYQLEFMINDSAGNFIEAISKVVELQELLNYDHCQLYYYLIRLMMQDVRMQENDLVEILEKNIDQFQNAQDVLTLFLVMGPQSELLRNKTTSIITDLYMGNHKIVEIIEGRKNPLQEIKSCLPLYFVQRAALKEFFYGPDFGSIQEKSNEKIAELIFCEKLSGVNSNLSFKDFESCYKLFYQVQQFMLLLRYHTIVLPQDLISCQVQRHLKNSIKQEMVNKGDNYFQSSTIQMKEQKLSGYEGEIDDMMASSQHLKNQINQDVLSIGSATFPSQNSSNIGGTSSNIPSRPKHIQQGAQAKRLPFCVTIQEFLLKFFGNQIEQRQAIQNIMIEFFECILYLEVKTGQMSAWKDEINQIFCTKKPQTQQVQSSKSNHKQLQIVIDNPNSAYPENSTKTQTSNNSTDESVSIKAASQESKQQTKNHAVNSETKLTNFTKYSKIEKLLVSMYEKVETFDKELVLKQHDEMFRVEFYKAAFYGQSVDKIDSETLKMNKVDFTDKFISYLALILELQGELDESQAYLLSKFDESRQEFTQCPCCIPKNQIKIHDGR